MVWCAAASCLFTSPQSILLAGVKEYIGIATFDRQRRLNCDLRTRKAIYRFGNSKDLDFLQSPNYRRPDPHLSTTLDTCSDIYLRNVDRRPSRKQSRSDHRYVGGVGQPIASTSTHLPSRIWLFTSQTAVQASTTDCPHQEPAQASAVPLPLALPTKAARSLSAMSTKLEPRRPQTKLQSRLVLLLVPICRCVWCIWIKVSRRMGGREGENV